MTEKKLETTVDRVYQGVYEAISKRSLRPGMKLGEASLAELFNVSRKKRSTPNDSDRLRKFLQRFGLEWNQVSAFRRG